MRTTTHRRVAPKKLRFERLSLLLRVVLDKVDCGSHIDHLCLQLEDSREEEHLRTVVVIDVLGRVVVNVVDEESRLAAICDHVYRAFVAAPALGTDRAVVVPQRAELDVVQPTLCQLKGIWEVDQVHRSVVAHHIGREFWAALALCPAALLPTVPAAAGDAIPRTRDMKLQLHVAADARDGRAASGCCRPRRRARGRAPAVRHHLVRWARAGSGEMDEQRALAALQDWSARGQPVGSSAVHVGRWPADQLGYPDRAVCVAYTSRQRQHQRTPSRHHQEPSQMSSSFGAFSLSDLSCCSRC